MEHNGGKIVIDSSQFRYGLIVVPAFTRSTFPTHYTASVYRLEATWKSFATCMLQGDDKVQGVHMEKRSALPHDINKTEALSLGPPTSTHFPRIKLNTYHSSLSCLKYPNTTKVALPSSAFCCWYFAKYSTLFSCTLRNRHYLATDKTLTVYTRRMYTIPATVSYIYD